MSYTNGPLISFPNRNELDFGAANNPTAVTIKGWPDRKLRADAILVDTTEVFACDTTAAKIQFGNEDDAKKFGEVEIPDGTPLGHLWFLAEDRDFDISSELDNGGDRILLKDDAKALKVTYVKGADSAAVTGKAYVTIFATPI